MNKIKRILAMSLAIILAIGTVNFKVPIVSAKSEVLEDLKMTYTNVPDITSYDDWENYALPVGNSGFGGSVFGGVETERIQLNEKSLWSGGPAEGRDYNGGNIEQYGLEGETLKKVQTLFAEGKTEEAISLCSSYLIGSSDGGYGFYLSYGNMYLDFDYGAEETDYENYIRTLDLREGIVTVEYDVNGVHYTRETFVSYPDNVMVTHISADKSEINVNVSVLPDNEPGDSGYGVVNNGYSRKWDTEVKNGLLSVSGQLDDNQMRFVSHSQVLSDGTVTDNTDDVGVTKASEVTIITTIGTDYKNEYPDYRTGENDAEVSERVLAYVTKASKKDYASLRSDHISDYSELFSRTELEIGGDPGDKTTSELLEAYSNDTATTAERLYVETLLFQYGRYLTIAGSREAPEDDPSRQTLPTNLQGLWVGANNSRWHSDYHLNVNLQMNYWGTYVTNLAECAIPLIDYVDSLREPGRVTAAIYAGIVSNEDDPENGFMVHTQNTPFGWTCPGYSFSWGWSPAVSAWILQNCWEYYEYTEDIDYLRDTIYPIMRECCVFYDQYLIRDEEGYLVSSPSYSPEHGPYTAGNTYEHTLIWQLYEDTITAAELLGVDSELADTWKANQNDLKGPIEIGDDGQIKEWYEETTLGSVDDYQENHRHLSHLLGLYPGDLITTETPDYLAAAEVSLDDRVGADLTGDYNSSAWSMVQRALCYARLGNGERAYSDLSRLITYRLHDNLYTIHPPFQIDSNYGYTAAVAEMLMQSNAGYINLLPALPEEWSDGSVSGLVARGNFEISMKWADSSLTAVEIISVNGGTATVQFENAALAKVIDSKGNTVKLTALSMDRISFDTEEGESYTVVSFPKGDVVPQNVEALRIDANSVRVIWDVYENADSYNVYRMSDYGDLIKIAEHIETESFTDTEASEVMTNVQYAVTALVNEAESDYSEKASVVSIAGAGMVDDDDSRITYVGAWSTWTQDIGLNYNDTIKYLNSPDGSQTISFDFVGTGIQVLTCTYDNRSQFDVTIDGKYYGVADTYSTAVIRQAVCFETTELERGKHTIVLTATGNRRAESTGNKVEFDAFRVLDNTLDMPEEIEIVNETGATVLGSKDETIQLKVNVTPENAVLSDVIWSSSDDDVLKVDENGVVSYGTKNGTAVITAYTAYDKSVSDSVTLTASDSTVLEHNVFTIDEAAKNNSTYERNSMIRYVGSWGNPYTGEPEKHYGTTKTATNSSGDYFEYTFTGTGIQIGAQKTKLQAAYEIFIDGVSMGTYSLFTTESDGLAQQIIYENMNLEFGLHTVKGVCVQEDSRTQVNLDFIKYYVPTIYSVEYADDCVDNSTRNSAITWSGSWGNPYTGEQHKHYGGEKTDTANNAATAPGSYFEYTFTGTGVEVIAQKNGLGGDYIVYIDGVQMDTVSLYDTIANGLAQQIIYSNLELENREHTIKCVVATGSNGKFRGNLDAIRVYSSDNSEIIPNKTSLSKLIGKYYGLEKAYYDTEKWTDYENALKVAVDVLNGSSSESDISDACSSLEAAINGLGDAVVTAPSLENVDLTIQYIDSDSALLLWNGTDRAEYYTVTVGDTEYKVTDTYLKLEGLTENTEYAVTLKASAEYNGVIATTENSVDTVLKTKDITPPVMEEIAVNGTTLSWKASDGAEKYYVYFNDSVSVIKSATLELGELTDGTEYCIVVQAVDENENKSVPAILSFVYEKPKESGDGEIIESITDTAQWSYDGVDTLYISGTGFCPEYTADVPMIPADIAESIKHIVIDDTIAGFGAYSFVNLTNLETVTGGENMRYLGIWAFKGLTKLTTVDFLGADLFGVLCYGAFSDCSSLNNVTLSDSLVTLGGAAFQRCTSLTAITIPAKVEGVGDNTFNGCTALETVVVTAAKAVRQNSFAGCTALKSVTLPEGLTTIDEWAFSGARIAELNLPSTLATVGNYAFYWGIPTIVNFAGSEVRWNAITFGINNSHLTNATINFGK